MRCVCYPGLSIIQLYTRTDHPGSHTHAMERACLNHVGMGRGPASQGSPWPRGGVDGPRSRLWPPEELEPARTASAQCLGACMSSPRSLLGPECDVQRLRVSFNVAAVGARLRGKHAAVCRYVTYKRACPYLPEWPSGGLKASRMLHGATGCPSVPAALTSISRLYLLLASSRLRNHALPPGSPHPYTFGGPRWSVVMVKKSCQERF